MPQIPMFRPGKPSRLPGRQHTKAARAPDESCGSAAGIPRGPVPRPTPSRSASNNHPATDPRRPPAQEPPADPRRAASGSPGTESLQSLSASASSFDLRFLLSHCGATEAPSVAGLHRDRPGQRNRAHRHGHRRQQRRATSAGFTVEDPAPELTLAGLGAWATTNPATDAPMTCLLWELTGPAPDTADGEIHFQLAPADGTPDPATDWWIAYHPDLNHIADATGQYAWCNDTAALPSRPPGSEWVPVSFTATDADGRTITLGPDQLRTMTITDPDGNTAPATFTTSPGGAEATSLDTTSVPHHRYPRCEATSGRNKTQRGSLRSECVSINNRTDAGRRAHLASVPPAASWTMRPLPSQKRPLPLLALQVAAPGTPRSGSPGMRP